MLIEAIIDYLNQRNVHKFANWLKKLVTQVYTISNAVYDRTCMNVPELHISQLIWLNLAVFKSEFQAEALQCFCMWGCFPVCQQRVSDTVRSILLCSANNILEWNRLSLGCNESGVMCCFWLTSGLMHAEKQMRASVGIQASETHGVKRMNIDTSSTEMHT